MAFAVGEMQHRRADHHLEARVGKRQLLERLDRVATLLAAGASISEPTCGACAGIGHVPASGGRSLRAFNRDWARRVLGGGGATVLLVTDGLERSDDADHPDASARALATEAERLRLSCRELIWLNPLLRFDGFEPRAAGFLATHPPIADRINRLRSLRGAKPLEVAAES